MNNTELYHFGTKGMKWGYYDGSRNGKRTARADAYDRKMMGEIMESLNAEDIAERSPSGNIVRKAYKDQVRHMSKAKSYDKKRSAASGIGYNVSFTVARASRNFKKSVSKGKRFISNFVNKHAFYDYNR